MCVCALRTMLINHGFHRHLHQLLELPLEAPGLVYKRMETREAAGAEAVDSSAGDALDALAGSPPDPPRLRPGAARGCAFCSQASVPRSVSKAGAASSRIYGYPPALWCRSQCQAGSRVTQPGARSQSVSLVRKACGMNVFATAKCAYTLHRPVTMCKAGHGHARLCCKWHMQETHAEGSLRTLHRAELILV